MRRVAVALGLLVILAPSSRGDEPEPARIRAAVERALRPIERSVREYNRHRDCFSCHHQAVPTFALVNARSRGFLIDDEALGSALDVTESDLVGSIESYQAGRGQPGGVTRAGYALWTLKMLDHPADETTAAVSGFLLGRDRERPGWRVSSSRPPSESNDVTATFVALASLRAYDNDLNPSTLETRLAAVRDWLIDLAPADNEERAFRLLALPLSGADAAAIEQAAADLLDHQNADGGWSQVDGRPSDAYATGSTLVALHRAGGLPTSHASYRRGLAFLMADQRPDGTWYVKSRSKPFQPYFESGFPYGPDQFISIAASAWATSALVFDSPEPSEQSSTPADCRPDSDSP